jgi:hypothetical protein
MVSRSLSLYQQCVTESNPQARCFGNYESEFVATAYVHTHVCVHVYILFICMYVRTQVRMYKCTYMYV